MKNQFIASFLIALSSSLDGGAAGIIAPYVETAAKVQPLCGAVKHLRLELEAAKQAAGINRASDLNAAALNM